MKKITNQDQKLRDDMMALYGALNAICFPLIPGKMVHLQAHYDLIDNLKEQYTSILERLFEDFDDE